MKHAEEVFVDCTRGHDGGRARAEMGRSYVTCVFVASLVVTHIAALAQAPPAPPAPARPALKVSASLLKRLAADLDDPRYEVRESATRRLIELGSAAVPALAASAEQGSLEAATRAVGILECLYLTGDDEASDASELALERMATSKKQPVAARATIALVTNQTFRQRRALERIVELGGIVKGPLGEKIDIRDPTALGTEIPMLQLGPSWTCGDEGLCHVKRLSSLRSLYIIAGSGVTDQGIEEVRQALPKLRNLERRGPAYLGVGGTAIDDGCVINSVRSGSAAERAGIHTGDVLLKFDGKKVDDFQSLVKMISQAKPGQTVQVLIRRDDQERKLDVVLDRWK